MAKQGPRPAPLWRPGGHRTEHRQPARTSVPPAFVAHPVILTDRPGPALFSKVGPWRRSEALKASLGSPVASIRELQAGRWLVGCQCDRQQATLARLAVLVGGIHIGCRIPVPTVEGVVSSIPEGDWAIRQVSADLTRDGHRVIEVARIKNYKGEETGLVRIAFEGTELPSEVWIAQSPFSLTPYRAPVRRCTNCQRLGHTKKKCRTRGARCPRCGRADHRDGGPCSETPSCINCCGRHSAAWGGCPEVLVRQRANTLKSQSYIPYSVALKRAREDLFPTRAPATGHEETRVNPDSCWAQDRAPNPLTTGTGPAPSYASMAAKHLAAPRGQASAGSGHPPPAGGGAQTPGPRKPLHQTRGPAVGARPALALQNKKGTVGGSQATTVTTLLSTPNKGGAEGHRPTATTTPKKVKHRGVEGSQPTAITTPLKKRCARKLTLSTNRRNELRQRAATLKPFLLAKQAQRVRTDVLAQQKRQNFQKKQSLMKTLRKIIEQDKKDRPEASRARDMAWDFLVILVNTKSTGDPTELIKLIIRTSIRATGEKIDTPPLTKAIDAALVLAGLKSDLADNHAELPDSF